MEGTVKTTIIECPVCSKVISKIQEHSHISLSQEAWHELVDNSERELERHFDSHSTFEFVQAITSRDNKIEKLERRLRNIAKGVRLITQAVGE